MVVRNSFPFLSPSTAALDGCRKRDKIREKKAGQNGTIILLEHEERRANVVRVVERSHESIYPVLLGKKKMKRDRDCDLNPFG